MQHDYNIANSDGATVRSDINSALQSLAECSSGATAPSTTFAYQWWADTANDLLKQRNAANSGWISVLTLSTGAVTSGGQVADDTSPQLGGDLDLNSNNITGTGDIPAANLTGTLSAIDGSNLTGISADVVDDTSPTLGGNLDADSKDITNIGNLTLYTSGLTGSIEHKRCDFLNAITANTWVPIYTITCGATAVYGTGTVRAKINMHNTGNWHIFESDWNWYQTNANPVVAQFGTDRSYYSSSAMMDFRLTQSSLVISVEAYFSNAIGGSCYGSLYTDVQYGGTNPTSLTFS